MEGQETSKVIIGSISPGAAISKAYLNECLVAVMNAIVLESTGCVLPSTMQYRTFRTGDPI